MSEFLASLGSAVLLSEQELMKVIRSAPRRYKVYQIPKRTPGTFRTIAQPAREVKALQYWVIENLLKHFPIHDCATAYRDGQGIRANVTPHTHKRYLLKMDFNDFFPSLTSRDFEAYLSPRAFGLNSTDVAALSKILFWKAKGTSTLRLSIGAPSSPIISNILMYDFDENVHNFCAQKNITYTRYADDLSFTADHSADLQAVETFVRNLCHSRRTPKLTLNLKKLVRTSKRSSRRITGLVISNEEEVSIGREKKREIRAMVHHFAAGKLDQPLIAELRGYLAYVKSVEPSFIFRLANKYTPELLAQLFIHS